MIGLLPYKIVAIYRDDIIIDIGLTGMCPRFYFSYKMKYINDYRKKHKESKFSYKGLAEFISKEEAQKVFYSYEELYKPELHNTK